MFSCGMGFRVLVVLFGVGVVWRASKVFGGICTVIGEWSEFRMWSLFVVDVYRVMLVELV